MIEFFNPKATDAEIVAALKYFVADPKDAPRMWEILKPCRALEAAGIEKQAADSTPLDTWWAPPGRTKYLILQGADDQIAPPENGEILKKDLGQRATLVNVAQAGHLLPVEQPGITAEHVLGFLRKISDKPNE